MVQLLILHGFGIHSYVSVNSKLESSLSSVHNLQSHINTAFLYCGGKTGVIPHVEQYGSSVQKGQEWEPSPEPYCYEVPDAVSL